jgi:2-succinyl-5-enolpyruvyl-6-hydroxy-3-cyclohexene-1-carboxylate synthase
VFGTPHGVDIAALCAATGTEHRPADVADLAAALAPGPGIRVVEVRAGRRELRAGHARLRRTLNEAVAEVLRS